MGRGDYNFNAVTKSDLPMLHQWLSEPHMRAHWGEAEKAFGEIVEHLGDPVVDIWIVSQDAPFAYVQDYPTHRWPMPHYADFPQGTRAIDVFIGAPAYLNKGHGSRFMRQHAEALLAKGYPAVAIDPSAENKPAIKAYRNAGFSGDTPKIDDDGLTVIPMLFKKESSV